MKYLYLIKIILHNLSIFKKKKYNNNKIILVEFNRLASSVISYSYLSNVLKKKFKADIFAYRLTAKKNFLKDIIWSVISKFYFLNTFNVYRSFGTSNFVNPGNLKILPKEELKIQYYLSKIKTKQSLLNLTIDSIYIGDLIYDSYLMNYRKPTIDLSDINFIRYFKHSLKTFFAWKNFFLENNVKGVIVSHSVYTLAIPLRIAISKGIQAYQCSSLSVYKLSKKNLYAYREFFRYKKVFNTLSSNVKKKSINLAKERIDKKLSGLNLPVGATKSGYNKKYFKRIIKKNNFINVLIATHCFFDNPHPYGKNLFVDFYEWLNFLGKISLKTKYNWYIKLHPDYLPETKNIIQKFLKKYPNIKYIPSKYSHHQLIDEGIDVALTCWGSIAHEYPLFKKLVINSSLNNPHINYDFSLHPKNTKEYEKILMNLRMYEKKSYKNENIYEFYAMNFILKKSWMLQKFYQLTGSKNFDYYFQFKKEFYRYWLKNEYSINKHFKIIKKLGMFVNSNFYLLGWNKKDLNNFYDSK